MSHPLPRRIHRPCQPLQEPGIPRPDPSPVRPTGDAEGDDAVPLALARDAKGQEQAVQGLVAAFRAPVAHLQHRWANVGARSGHLR